jgi:hypothetical protein
MLACQAAYGMVYTGVSGSSRGSIRDGFIQLAIL